MSFAMQTAVIGVTAGGVTYAVTKSAPQAIFGAAVGSISFMVLMEMF